MSIGRLKEFDVRNGQWASFVDRMEMYFLVNEIAEDLQVPTLIAAMGDEAYELLVNLASPEKPSALTYSQAVELMRQHLQPTPSALAERYRFRQRRQGAFEDTASYVAELKRLSRNCKFGGNLSDNLRDQFVCGLRSDVIKQRLFAEDDTITFAGAVKLAGSLEAAERDAAAVDESATAAAASAVHALKPVAGREPHARAGGRAGGAERGARTNCAACGARSHDSSSCRFRKFVCSRCQRIGHLRRVCPEVRTPGTTASGSGCDRERGQKKRGFYFGDAEGGNSWEEDDIEENLNLLSLNQYRPYLGSFPVCGGERALSDQLLLMKDNECAVPVLVVVAPSGVKVCDPEDQNVRMYHALRRISFATCESASSLFAFVAREPRAEPLAEPLAGPAPRHYCHAFRTDTPEQAEELNSLVGDAFRMAFASQLQPSAPLWSAELSGGECARAPDSLPGLTHHYPRSRDRSPSKCNIMGMQHEASPTSSEESNSPTEINCYRRLGERAPLMKRLAMGLSGALLQPSDDDSTPLVADTPTTPTNLPLCMNGYVNEASEAEARSRDTRESNRELTPRHDSLHNDLDEFAKCNNIKNGSGSAGCSAATSSSSGASSCGGSHGSGNNNVPRAEPELRHAPWFQAGIPREIALEILSNQPVGAFMVRCSTTQTGCFALSVRVPRDFQPSGIAHYLILRTPKGYKIKGFTKEFTSLSALVTHHSVMPELLPCPLRLARRAPPPRAPRDLEEPRHTPRHLPFRPQLDV